MFTESYIKIDFIKAKRNQSPLDTTNLNVSAVQQKKKKKRKKKG
jgi:hypothetical protein